MMDNAENPSPTKMFECKQAWRVDTTADMVRSYNSSSYVPGFGELDTKPRLERNQGLPNDLKKCEHYSMCTGALAKSPSKHPAKHIIWFFMHEPFPLLSTNHMTQVSLALCPNEDRLCAVTSDNQLFEVKIIAQNIKDSDMKPVISLFHGPGLSGGGITGMDTCVRKPLVATCGMDRTIRVWNIVEQRLDLSKAFQEEPYSLAMHPSGLHLVVGFADKIRLMNLLMDDVRPCHEISIKQCREVKFSNGGSMFAAVNGNVVTIFDFNTYDKLADLRGHNSKVISRFFL